MIFRYTYYSLYGGYKNMGENHIPGFYSVGLITLLQALPCYSIFTILFKLKITAYQLDKITGVICLLGLLVINTIYFLPKARHKKIFDSIAKLDTKHRQYVRTAAIVYSLTAVGLIVLLFNL